MRVILKKAETFSASDAEGLPYKTHLQVGAEYFVSTNIDVSDGLFNGSTGTLCSIEYALNSTGKRVPQQVWMDFHNPMVGSAARKNTNALQISRGINPDWTCIKMHERSMNLGRQYRGMELIRKQLPLIAANAMTIAKSQGSSLKFVVACPTTEGPTGRKRYIRREELYVACSRATSLNGLFISGNFRAPPLPRKNDVVTAEMSRLQQHLLQCPLIHFQDMVNNNEITVFFMNIQYFVKHRPDICADQCAMSSQYLAFVEPHILQHDSDAIEDFITVHRINSASRHTSDGALLYSNNNIDVPNSKLYSLTGAGGHCLFLAWVDGDTCFAMAYRSPSSSIVQFKQLFRNLLNDTNCHVILFGDINIDLSKPEGNIFISFMAGLGFHSALDVNISTTTAGTHIDCVFSNVTGLTASIYETYFSHHKAICIAVPKF